MTRPRVGAAVAVTLVAVLSLTGCSTLPWSDGDGSAPTATTSAVYPMTPFS